MAYVSRGRSARTRYRRIRDAVQQHLNDILLQLQTTAACIPTPPAVEGLSEVEGQKLLLRYLPTKVGFLPTLQPSCHKDIPLELMTQIDYRTIDSPTVDDVVTIDCPTEDDLGHYLSGIDSGSEELPVHPSERNIDTSFSLREFLKHWALECNVSHTSLNKLLKGLHNIGTSLPLDSRTLLQTHRKVDVVEMGVGGKYANFGLQESLMKRADQFTNVDDGNILSLSFNIDGIPLFNSSKTEFWPILCCIHEFDPMPPFPVSIYCGIGKPPIEYYFEDFITSLSDLMKNGLTYKDTNFEVKVRAFILDDHAKAHAKCVKLYSGYSSCDRCTTVGEYHGRVTFPEIDAPLRTDESFLAQTDESHHQGLSPLAKLDMGLVSCFPLDYMHLVCLGVVKRCIHFWLRGAKGIKLKNARLSVAYQTAINASLLQLRDVWPTEFSRRPRSMSDFERWKATEFRSGLLYFLPVVLKGFFPREVYDHFMLLHCGITILAGNLCLIENDQARKLLQAFVTGASEHYSNEFIVGNVHGLIHLCNDVKRFGKLDSFGAFKYENQLGVMKKQLRGTNRPLGQLCKRFSEKEAHPNPKPNNRFGVNNTFVPHSIHETGPTRGHHGNQYRKIIGPNYTLSKHPRDSSIILKDGSVMVAKKFIVEDSGNILVVGYIFKRYSDFYSYPIDSSLLSIYFVESMSDVLTVIPLHFVKSKTVLLPYKQGFVSFPLLHLP